MTERTTALHLPRRSILLALAGSAAVPLLGTGARAQGKPKPAGQVVIGISQ